MEDFLWLPGGLSLNANNYLLLNAPLPYFGGRQWFEAEPDPVPDLLRCRERLGRLLDDLARQGWPGEQTLLFGFSQGCVVATDVALHRRAPLLGVVGVSGYVFYPEGLEHQVVPEARRRPWIITHGTYDELLPIRRTREQVRLLRRMGLPIEWYEVAKGHTVDPGDEMAVIRDWMQRQWA